MDENSIRKKTDDNYQQNSVKQQKSVKKEREHDCKTQ